MAIIGFFKSASNTDQIPEKKTDPEGTEQQDKDYAAQEMPSTYGEYGAHNVLVGHHVSYAAGDHQGKGKVVATGEHGCTVSDSTGREHRVFWHEVSGHHAGSEKDDKSVEKQTKTSEHESEKMNKALGGAAMLKGFVFENEAGQIIGVGGADQFLKAHVKGYTRADGVFVAEHDDKRQSAKPKPPKNPDHGRMVFHRPNGNGGHSFITVAQNKIVTEESGALGNPSRKDSFVHLTKNKRAGDGDKMKDAIREAYNTSGGDHNKVLDVIRAHSGDGSWKGRMGV